VADRFAGGRAPNELVRGAAIYGTEGASELAAATYHDVVDKKPDADSSVVNWALKRVLSSASNGLSQQDAAALNSAMLSGNQQQTSSGLYNAISKSPAFAAQYERAMKRANGEH
jgi:hypothetical protein